MKDILSVAVLFVVVVSLVAFAGCSKEASQEDDVGSLRDTVTGEAKSGIASYYRTQPGRSDSGGICYKSCGNSCSVQCNCDNCGSASCNPCTPSTSSSGKLGGGTLLKK